jgi:sugar/nucleoside kinase (ribokinase family)
MNAKRKILCAGQLVADVVAYPVDFRLLGADAAGADTARADSIALKNGGDAMNTAVGLARLGSPVVFSGRVGEDDFGRMLERALRENGVDAAGLRRDPAAPTSTAIGLVNAGGERVFIYSGGSNDSFCAADVPESLINDCCILHVGGAYLLPALDGEGAASLFSKARALGAATTMDVTWDTTGRWLETIRPCLKHLDYFLPSIGEARHIAGAEEPEEIADLLLAEGVGTVVIKLGEDGAYLKARGAAQGERVPAHRDMPAVDTTGAGDAFVAGFLAGLSRGWDAAECARFACATAAFAIGALGATDGVPSFDRAFALMRQGRAAMAK